MTETDRYPVSVPLDLLESGEIRIDLSLPPGALAALRERLGTMSVDNAAATLVLRRAGRIVEVEGDATAAVVQACVVTGEPVLQVIHEPVRLRLVPPGDPLIASGDIDADDEWDVEPFAAGAIPLSDIVEEAVILGLDPYPRAPGAAFEQAADPDDGAGEAGSSAFAALARLKPARSGG